MSNQIEIRDNELLIHKIGKCLASSLKSTDYFVGYAPYNFQFEVGDFKGETLFSERITPIEQAIVGILSIDESASIDRIGKILGFNVLQDSAEYSILSDSIKLLMRHNVIDGDDSLYCLTDEGKVFAAEGKRSEKASYNFTLWYNKEYPELNSLKECLHEDHIIDGVQLDVSQEIVNLELVKSIAEKQAPKVHNPSDERVLVGAELLKATSFSYLFYACFIRNVLTGEVRTIVYDESRDEINNDLSALIDHREVLKAELFDHIEETVFIPEEIQVKEITKVEENDIEIEVSEGDVVKKLHKKALYDEISFENELGSIFYNDQPDEVWLISPWIGYYFVESRVPMIENVLKSGSKVFIAYSQKDPRDKRRSEMVNQQAQKEIDRLLKSYSGFFCVELPKVFHTKNVFEVKGNQIIMFSGSFNILSFAIQESHKIIRGEQMAFVNPQKAKTEYRSYVDVFARIYMDQYKNQLLDDEGLTIESLKENKLKHFGAKSSLKSEIEDILDLIDEKITVIQKNDWSQKLNDLQKIVSPLLARGIISQHDKNNLRNEISLLEESAKMLDLDEDVKNRLTSIQEHVESLKVAKSAISMLSKDEGSDYEGVEDYSELINTLYQKKGSGNISFDNLKTARNILRNKKFTTEHQIVRFMVSLNLVLLAIKKKKEKIVKFEDINNHIISLIVKSEDKFPNLSIFIDGDITFVDLAGIQLSFYKVPHTEKSKAIVEARNNKVTENKKHRLHLYADELFNIVFKRN